MNQSTSSNQLRNEKSAYLQQHQSNPVNWYPFGPEALQLAQDRKLPIFLSVGYSSCHWCHVMAHESFENHEIASFLNENFINIKVDKEEYPDLDSYYQLAAQLFVQSGGWPLSAFLLPDLRPFFAGTYFPPFGKGEHTGFMELIQELVRAYREEPQAVEENAAQVTKAIEEGLVPKDRVEYEGHFPAPMAVVEAVKQFEDKENGGYGAAPKFPLFPFYEWAVEQMLEGMIEQSTGEHIIFSIERMLMGALTDHARGGIHRYSVDRKFKVPHFEKMLYDQAGLLRVLSKLGNIYPSPLVFDQLMNTLDYLEAEMMSEQGHFFSAQDADSEGVEGLYFTYTEDEFENAINSLDDEELTGKMDQLKKWFDISKQGNFEAELNVISLDPTYKNEYFTPEGWSLVRKVRQAIVNSRKERIPPPTDSKGISSWNFMMISALVDVMQFCQIDPIKQRASKLFNHCVEACYQTFLTKNDDNSMTMRHTTTKEASLPYLEDFAFFLEAQLRIYEMTGNPVFKANVQDTLEFIGREFVEEDKLLTRAKSTDDHQLYPNRPVNSFDQSFKSPAATVLAVARRASVLLADQELMAPFEKVMEEFIHEALKNPVSAGEALRALTYPKEVYRVVKVPQKWLQEGKFIGFLTYFLPRFVLDYHAEDNDSWQICNIETCELQGHGIDEFLAALTPEKSNSEPADD